MSNGFALFLAVLIVALIALDLLTGFGASLFLARKFFDLLRWVAFWR